MRGINLRLFLILIATVLVLGAGVYGLHEYQIRRQVALYTQLAEAAKQKGDLNQAIDYLERYNRLVPGDLPVLEELSLLLADAGRLRDAQNRLSTIVGIQTDRHDLRRRLIEVCFLRGRPGDARVQLEILLKEHPDDALAHHQLALCSLAVSQHLAARDELHTAITIDPSRLDSAGLLAAVELEIESDESGESKEMRSVHALNTMVLANGSNYEAPLIRGNFFLNHLRDGNYVKEAVLACRPETTDDAASDTDERQEFLQIIAKDAVDAVELALQETQEPGSEEPAAEEPAAEEPPRELGPLLLAALCAQELGEPLRPDDDPNDDVEEWGATRLAERITEISPTVPAAYSILANEALKQGEMEEALGHLETGVREVGFDRSLFFNLARLKIQSESVDEAETLIERLNAEPGTDALVAYLNAHIEMQKGGKGDWRRASLWLEDARNDLDDLPDLRRDTNIALGICYEQLHRSDLQRAAYDRAVTDDPFSRPARLGLASALEALGQRDLALKEYEAISGQNGGRISPMIAVQIARLQIRENVSAQEDNPIWEQVFNYITQSRESIAALRDDPDTTASQEEIDRSLLYLDILEAEYHLARRDLDAAEATLAAATERKPDAEALWNALVVVQGRKADFQAAEETLRKACEIHKDSPTMRLARARHALVKSGPDARDVLRELARPVASDSAEARLNVASTIGTYARLIGDFDLATQLYKEIADRYPNRLDVRLALFDLALRQSEEDGSGSAIQAMSGILDEVAAIEGKGGPFWSFGEAVRLVVQHTPKGDASTASAATPLDDEAARGLAEAERLLDSAEIVWRDWARIPLLRGRIQEIRGDRRTATDSFVEAYYKGFRQPEFIYQLVKLLYAQERFNDAAGILASLSAEDAPNLTDLAQAANAVSARMDDTERAVKIAALALQIAENAANDADDHLAKLTYGQILFLNERFEDAERVFNEAIELAPTEPVPWLTLIDFYQRTDRTELAEETRQRAMVSIEESRRTFAAAQAYQILGNDEKAAESFASVAEESDADPETLRSAAGFYIRQGEVAKAEELLKRIVNTEDPENAFREHIIWARRQLAALALARGGDENRKHARELVELNLRDLPESGADLRVLAQILAASRETSDHSRAIGILRDLIRESNAPRDQDRLMLAQLELGRYSRSDRKSQLAAAVNDSETARAEESAARGSLNRAIEQLQQLAVATQGDRPTGAPNQAATTDRTAEYRTYLTLYIDALILNREFSEARTWSDKLKPLTSSPIQLATVDAMILAKMGEHTRARDLMVAQIPACTTAAEIVAIARTLERLASVAEQDLRSDAESNPSAVDAACDAYRAAARSAYEHEKVQDDPDLSLTLVLFLAKSGEPELAAERLSSGWQSAGPGTAANAALAVIHADTDASVQAQALEILKQIADKNPEELSTQVALAEGLAWLGDYAAAEQLYQSLLDQHPDSWAVANNLAFVLGASGQSERALKLIDSLLEQQGQLPDVLDTKASILLQAKDYQQAFGELQSALSQADVAVYYFHEALALHNMNDAATAAKSWTKSQVLGLTPSHVHPTERDAMQLLAQRYGDFETE